MSLTEGGPCASCHHMNISVMSLSKSKGSNCHHIFNILSFLNKCCCTEWYQDFFVIKGPHFFSVEAFPVHVSASHFSPEYALLKHSSSQRWRSCWRGALLYLIQPSLRAQSCIHSCHILILSLDSARGHVVKELIVCGAELYTKIHLQICNTSTDTSLQGDMNWCKGKSHENSFTLTIHLDYSDLLTLGLRNRKCCIACFTVWLIIETLTGTCL